MKNLKNHTLLYDKDCPMCEVYSSAFIKCGMLENDGRENFSQMSAKNEIIIDYERAKNEIALINQNNKKVIYGLDSLLVIIGNSFPTLEKIGRVKPLYWFFKKFYSFISYNRKVIVPSSKLITEKSCVPSFNLKYRVLYMFFSILFTSFILGKFLNQYFYANFIFEKVLLFFLFLFFWQSLMMRSFLKEKYFDYVGNLATIIVIIAVFIIPALFFNLNIVIVYYFLTFQFFLMLFEHLRRSKLLKIGFLPTFSISIFGSLFLIFYSLSFHN